MLENESRFTHPLNEIAAEIAEHRSLDQLYEEYQYPINEIRDLKETVKRSAHRIYSAVEGLTSWQTLGEQIVEDLHDWDEADVFISAFILEDSECVRDLPAIFKRVLLDFGLETTIREKGSILLSEFYLGRTLGTSDRDYYEKLVSDRKESQLKLRQVPTPKTPPYLK